MLLLLLVLLLADDEVSEISELESVSLLTLLRAWRALMKSSITSGSDSWVVVRVLSISLMDIMWVRYSSAVKVTC